MSKVHGVRPVAQRSGAVCAARASCEARAVVSAVKRARAARRPCDCDHEFEALPASEEEGGRQRQQRCCAGCCACGPCSCAMLKAWRCPALVADKTLSILPHSDMRIDNGIAQYVEHTRLPSARSTAHTCRVLRRCTASARLSIRHCACHSKSRRLFVILNFAGQQQPGRAHVFD